MKGLKSNVEKLPPSQKYCSLLFDEISISSKLYYNEHLDRIEGFEDYGYERTQKFADHALVFMVCGITKKYKQPIAISFAKGQQIVITFQQLLKMYTISDQEATNEAA